MTTIKSYKYNYRLTNIGLIFGFLLFQIQIANCLTYSFYEGEELQEYELANNELLLFTKESDSGLELDWVIQTHFFRQLF